LESLRSINQFLTVTEAKYNPKDQRQLLVSITVSMVMVKGIQSVSIGQGGKGLSAS